MIGNIFGRGAQSPDIAVEYQKHMERMQIEQMQMHVADQRRIQAAQQSAQYDKIFGQGAQKPSTTIPRFDPNKSEAFQIPLSQAITMWKLKFGDTWYDANHPRPETGNFYDDVFDRINNAQLFEKVDGWYRLKEGV